MDTLKYFEELRAAGNSELQAKAHIYAVNGALNSYIEKDDLAKFATKEDVKTLESHISAEFGIIKKITIGIFIVTLAAAIKSYFGF